MNTLRLTLRQLQIFVAVARSGTTTAASAEIALSQSATSSAVNELERLLSLRLFDRAGKRLLLNDNGRALLPRALALLDGAAGIELMSRDGSAQAQPGHASAWRSKVVIGNTAAICDAVAAFELDVGLIEGPCHQAALAVTPWHQDEMVVVTSPDSAWARMSLAGERVPMRTLREGVWLVRELGSGTREATDQSLLPHLRSYRRSIELGSSEAIKHAAEAGMGVACLSSWVVSDALEAGRLCRIATTLPRQLRQSHLVVHRDKQPTASLLAFVDQVSGAEKTAP